MSDPFPTLPLGSVLRKAALDAGFDLEPERDGGWWRLRGSDIPGVAWIHPLGSGEPRSPGGAGALVALPLASQLAELQSSAVAAELAAAAAAVPLPRGAGGAVLCPSPGELLAALRRVRLLMTHTPEALQRRWRSETEAAARAAGATVLATEAVTEIRRRVGQDLYRESLIDYWGGRCAVTGLGVPELLRASHAKPWAEATDVERLDVYNGLLLAVHLDALFDRGYLTFDDQGRGITSPDLPPAALAIMGLADAALRIDRLNTAHLPYLAYHRTHVFRAGGRPGGGQT